MEDHVQPIGLVFITMREWFPCHLKKVRALDNIDLNLVSHRYVSGALKDDGRYVMYGDIYCTEYIAQPTYLLDVL